MIDFFYSDPHFGHEQIITNCRRPFRDSDHMTESLISNYNDCVGEDQLVVWVGDCFFGKKSESREILAALNGEKILVKGNHDAKEHSMFNLGFDFVCRRIDLLIHGEKVTICHFPFRFSWLQRLFAKHDDRFPGRRAKNDGQWLIHGHSHGKVKVRDRQIDVGVDAWDYHPVPMRRIESIIQRGKR